MRVKREAFLVATDRPAKVRTLRETIATLGVPGAVIALSVFGVVRNVPWMVEENRRIEPWKWPLVWSSELTATLVFIHYALSFLLPAWVLSLPDSRLTFKAFLVAMALDLSFDTSCSTSPSLQALQCA